MARMLFNFVGYFAIKYPPLGECGVLQLYAATSARFRPAKGDAVGMSISKCVAVARGTDGKTGSGSYTINFDGENVSTDVDKLLVKAKADGTDENMWAHIMEEIGRLLERLARIPLKY